MKKIFETTVKELKNHYTTDVDITFYWNVKQPIIQKILFGVEIQKPSAYRIYETENGTRRTWVFGDLELNPSRYNLDKIKK